MEGPITPTCRVPARLLLAAAGLSIAFSPVAARTAATESALATYVGARAAGMSGNLTRSAELYARLAVEDPSNRIAARRAVSQALAAGDFKLALSFARRSASNGDMAADTRLLLIADDLRRNKGQDALRLLQDHAGDANLGFLTPFIAAWVSASRGDQADALARIADIQSGNLAALYLPVQRALLLARLGRTKEAGESVAAALRAGGTREVRVRILLAAAFARAGDQATAQTLLTGRDAATARARGLLLRGDLSGKAVDTPAEAFAELLLSMAVDFSRDAGRSLPIALARVATFAAPKNAEARIVVGYLLDNAGRTDLALDAFRSVASDDVFAGEARDGAVRALVRADRKAEALALATTAASASQATADDWQRLGDVLADQDRPAEAADAYGRAIAMVDAGGPGGELWSLYLLKGSALDQAKLWPEAKAALQKALQLSPKQPLVLNYLGYAELERNEDLKLAERMIREASSLAPDDASITDSLGWAQYKQGHFAEAIETLQRAAQMDATQSEIREHLGDALYSAGRRFEARFAWRAALETADDDSAARLDAKIDHGLTQASATP